MPRQTELLGYGIAVQDVDLPIRDPKDGQIIHDGLGQPKTERCKKVLMQDQFGDLIAFTLNDEARMNLIGMLTGGIQIPDIELVRQ